MAYRRTGCRIRSGKCSFYLGDEKLVSSLSQKLNDVFGPNRADDNVIRSTIGKTGVLTSVIAVDSDAAKTIARKRIRQTIDILSFFANLGGSPRTQIVFAADAGPKILKGFVFCGPKVSGRLTSERVGPLAPFSFAAPHLERAGFPQTSEILQVEKPTEFQERLISALQWAGRASVESRNEEAFLLFAIAFESLLIGSDDKTEITETLALRAAHVIAAPKSRLRVYKDVKRLYGIRSKIVHRGDADVGEADLSLMRYLVRLALLSMLCDSRFAVVTTEASLVDWFREKLLDISTEGEGTP